MKTKKWKVSKPDAQKCGKLCASGKISPLTAAVLCARGMDEEEKIKDFLSTDLARLHDPFLLRDMEKAVAEIRQTVDRKEKITVFGDYDVDGVTSTCIMVRYLRSLGAECDYYIPDRTHEGYGLNREALRRLYEGGTKLVITVDSGITAREEVAYAAGLGLRVVITDHHECKEGLPDCIAVVNPHREDCPYPFKELAGVGVAFKVVCALAGSDSQAHMLEQYGDLVAVGTVADVMQLCGENRVIVSQGLRIIAKTRNLGLKMLMRESGMEGKQITSGMISFILAPRINAAGRLGCASQAEEMFLTEDISLASKTAALLCQQNKDRQLTENRILEQAMEKLRREYDPIRDKMIVLWGEGWPSGIIGIVSSRLSDRYGCPSVLISVEDGVGKGSGRSIEGFNLFNALEACSDHLIKFGGHALAAGLTISKEELEPFRQAIYHYAEENLTPEALVPTLCVDCCIEPNMATEKNIQNLSLLEPYGMGNPQPVFVLEDLTVEEITPISSDKHLKMLVSKDGYSFTAMLFGTNSINCGFAIGNHIDVAANLEINEFRGRRTVQLIVKDVHLSRCEQEKDEKYFRIYHTYINDGPLKEAEARAIMPDRKEMVAVWRHIASRTEDGEMRLPVNALSRKVTWESKRDINIGKVFVCLDVFSESQLLSYNFKDDLLNIRLKHFQGKADISKSVVLGTLKSMCRSWDYQRN